MILKIQSVLNVNTRQWVSCLASLLVLMMRPSFSVSSEDVVLVELLLACLRVVSLRMFCVCVCVCVRREGLGTGFPSYDTST